MNVHSFVQIEVHWTYFNRIRQSQRPVKQNIFYLAIIEFGFRRIWRILQIEEGVIHRGRTTEFFISYESRIQ